MDAIKLYKSYKTSMAASDVTELCQQILKADGDRAWVIYLAKSAGWWKDEVAEPCQAIMEAPGSRAMAVYMAKSKGWWLDSVADPCQAILDAPGDRARVIAYAKTDGWWKADMRPSTDGYFKMIVKRNHSDHIILERMITIDQLPPIGCSVINVTNVVTKIVFNYEPDFHVIVYC